MREGWTITAIGIVPEIESDGRLVAVVKAVDKSGNGYVFAGGYGIGGDPDYAALAVFGGGDYAGLEPEDVWEYRWYRDCRGEDCPDGGGCCPEPGGSGSSVHFHLIKGADGHVLDAFDAYGNAVVTAPYKYYVDVVPRGSGGAPEAFAPSGDADYYQAVYYAELRNGSFEDVQMVHDDVDVLGYNYISAALMGDEENGFGYYRAAGDGVIEPGLTEDGFGSRLPDSLMENFVWQSATGMFELFDYRSSAPYTYPDFRGGAYRVMHLYPAGWWPDDGYGKYFDWSGYESWYYSDYADDVWIECREDCNGMTMSSVDSDCYACGGDGSCDYEGGWFYYRDGCCAAGYDEESGEVEYCNCSDGLDIDGYRLIPDGKQAVELNAEAPSMLYQAVLTEPGETYSWVLYHRAVRTYEDTMAVAIAAGAPAVTSVTNHAGDIPDVEKAATEVEILRWLGYEFVREVDYEAIEYDLDYKLDADVLTFDQIVNAIAKICGSRWSARYDSYEGGNLDIVLDMDAWKWNPEKAPGGEDLYIQTITSGVGDWVGDEWNGYAEGSWTNGGWRRYEGTYTVPEGQYVTYFCVGAMIGGSLTGYRDYYGYLDSVNLNRGNLHFGNLLDAVEFAKEVSEPRNQSDYPAVNASWKINYYVDGVLQNYEVGNRTFGYDGWDYVNYTMDRNGGRIDSDYGLCYAVCPDDGILDGYAASGYLGPYAKDEDAYRP